MVDAADSKSATCEGVGVQVPSPVCGYPLFLLNPLLSPMAQTRYSAASLPAVTGARVEIVCSKWYGEISQSLTKRCREVLLAAGCEEPAVHILPGCLEIPLAVRRLLRRGPSVEAVVVFGVILKGDTYHFDIVKDLTMSGLERVSFECDVPIINEILPVNTIEDAQARAAEDDRNKGIEAGIAAVEIIHWRRAHPV
jgi:6,7-dimethyl-8-ribityllumazine synthase